MDTNYHKGNAGRRSTVSYGDDAPQSDYRDAYQASSRPVRSAQQRGAASGSNNRSAQRYSQSESHTRAAATRSASKRRPSVANNSRYQRAREAQRAAAASGAEVGRRPQASNNNQHSGSNVRAARHQSERQSSYASYANDNAQAYSRDAAVRYQAKRRKHGHKVGLIIGIIVAIILAAGIACGLYYYFTISGNLKSDKGITNVVEAVPDQPYYVLLLGGDSRTAKANKEKKTDTDKDNRTDSIMVARVDEKNKQVTLLSVPRDLRVNVPGGGYQKINAAIEYGGYDTTIEMVNRVMDIKISYYVFIYFSGFKHLVDQLDGVTVDVPEGTYYAGVTVPAGEDVTINGKEALVLARCRHGNPPDQGAYAMGDYQRTLNQRNLIKAIAKKVLAQDVSDYPKLMKSLSKCIETNMSVSKIVSLATNMKGMDVNSINSGQMPEAGDLIGDGWYAALYDDVWQIMRENFKSGEDLMKGLKKFDKENNGNDLTSSCTDGDVYAYAIYRDHYGDFEG